MLTHPHIANQSLCINLLNQKSLHINLSAKCSRMMTFHNIKLRKDYIIQLQFLRIRIRLLLFQTLAYTHPVPILL